MHRAILFHARDLPLPPVGVNHMYMPRAVAKRASIGGKSVMTSAEYRQAVGAAPGQTIGARVLVPVMQEYGATLQDLLKYGQYDRLELALLDWVKRKKPPMALTIGFHIGSRSFYRRDLDGLVKFPLDVMCTWLGINDAYFTEISMHKYRADQGQAESISCLFSVLADRLPKQFQEGT